MIKQLMEGQNIRALILKLNEAREDLPEEFQHMEFVVTGNSKIGPDTWIMNMGSATDCPSMLNGECLVCAGGVECYAKKAERGMYPEVLPARRRQDVEFHALTAEEIVEDILHKYDLAEVKPIFLRISEAGDFKDQEDVQKIFEIAELLNNKMRCYIYTARRSLDFKGSPYNLVINGSGFTDEEREQTNVHNVFKAIPTEEYTRIIDSNWEKPIEKTVLPTRHDARLFSQEFGGEISSGSRRTKDVEVTHPSEREDTEHMGFIEGLKCQGDCKKCDYCKIHHGQVVYVEYH